MEQCVNFCASLEASARANDYFFLLEAHFAAYVADVTSVTQVNDAQQMNQ